MKQNKSHFAWLGGIFFLALFILNIKDRFSPEETLLHDRDREALEDRTKELNKTKAQYVIWFFKNWVLERFASILPVPSWRVAFHRMRGLDIGKNVYIGYDVIFDRIYPHMIHIDDHVEIGDRCIITAHARSQSNKYKVVIEPVHIEQGVWIMPAAIVTPGVTIGENAVIGTGAIIRQNIPANHIVLGVPSKVLPISPQQ